MEPPNPGKFTVYRLSADFVLDGKPAPEHPMVLHPRRVIFLPISDYLYERSVNQRAADGSILDEAYILCAWLTEATPNMFANARRTAFCLYPLRICGCLFGGMLGLGKPFEPVALIRVTPLNVVRAHQASLVCRISVVRTGHCGSVEKFSLAFPLHREACGGPEVGTV